MKMDAKEIKSQLKAARECISKKEYKEALKYCKNILKSDKSNYNALVFVGVAAEGLEQGEQALDAYQKAIEVDGEQILAWQGLCGFYEKTGSNDKELISVYKKLILLRKGDQNKCLETKGKLASRLHRIGQFEEANVVITEIVSEVGVAEASLDALKTLIALAGHPDIHNDSTQLLLKEAFGRLMNCTDLETTEQEEYNKQYITFLINNDTGTETLVAECTKMAAKFPDSAFPREILCEITLLRMTSGITYDENIVNCDSLRRIKSDNAYVLFLDAQRDITAKDYKASKEKIMKGITQKRSCVTAWVLLSRVHVALSDPALVIKCSEEALRLLQTSGSNLYGLDRDVIESHAHLLKAQALLLQLKSPDTVQNAIDICLKVMNKSCDNKTLLSEALKVKVKAHLHLEQWTPAHEAVKELYAVDEINAKLYEAVIQIEETNYDTAITGLEWFLKQCPENGEALYQMGRVYWLRGQNNLTELQTSYNYLVQAAKSDPNNARCFLLIGHYQTKVIKNKEKGLLCYEKAYRLDKSGDEEIGVAFVDALRFDERQEAALAVLKDVTGRAPAGTCLWAWLRLGLQYLKTDPDQAVISLQCALRADPKHYNAWECLGEAFLSRGSYTAALKAFARACELRPDSIFSHYQIGTIKLKLEQYTDAIQDFMKILQTTPDYVPALKGIGESYLELEKAAVRKFFHGQAIDYCEQAIVFLCRAASCSQLSCIWKLLGDCFCTLHAIPRGGKCRVQVPEILLGQKANAQTLDKPAVLALSSRCYGMAIKIQPDCGALWHDLGLTYLRQARCSSECVAGQRAISVQNDPLQATLLMQKSQQCVQRALKCQPDCHTYWNTLGLIVLSKEIDNKALAQHCFIKSVQCEQKNAVAWTNLGALYLQCGDVNLAHEAFKVAQSLEPSYVASWIGQALIAEIVGESEEAMDLFRHSTEIGTHTEAALGYAQFVVKLLKDTEGLKSDWNRYLIENMHAIPAACDAMAKYTERIKTNPTAFNIHGLLLERQKLYQGAKNAFEQAICLLRNDTSRSSELRETSLNLARVLVNLGECDRAVQLYMEASPATVEEQCGMALALFRMAKHEDSLAHYETALGLTSADTKQANTTTSYQEDATTIHAAMGMVVYSEACRTAEVTGVKPDLNSTKTQLFKCIQGDAPSVAGLKALMSVGLLEGDTELATAVQAELRGHYQQETVNADASADFAYMTASLHALQNDTVAGKRALARQVHTHPGSSLGWSYLVQYLLAHDQDIGETVARCCRVAMMHDKYNQQQSLGVWLGVGMLGAGHHSRTKSDANSFTAAQRAVYLNPGSLEAWVSLIGSMYAELVTRRCLGQPESLAQPLITLVTHFMARVEGLLSQKAGRAGRLQALHLWCVRQYVIALIADDRLQQAQEFLEQALWLYEEDLPLQNLLAYLKQNLSVLKLNAVNDSLDFTRLLLVQLYLAHSLAQDAETVLKNWLPQARTKPRKLLAFTRIAFFALKQIMVGSSQSETMQTLFNNACSEARKLEPQNVVIHFFMGVMALFQDNKKQGIKSLQACVGHWGKEQSLDYGREKAQALLHQLLKTVTFKEESDAQKIEPKKEAKVQKDPFDD